MTITNINRPKVPLTSVETLDEITYCVNCIDRATGQRGTFAYDEKYFQLGMGHYAISPVFDSVEGLFTWSKLNGFHYHKLSTLFTMSRNFE